MKKPIVQLKTHLEEHEDLGGDAYKVLGEFKPSSLDHKTIQKEFHHHLAKHGFYSHSDVHPLVRSPKDNEHLTHWGKITSGRAKHEGWHSDSTGDKTQNDKLVGVWSTKHSTKIRRAGEHGEIHHASQAGHTTVFDDRKAQHKASGHNDRWFVRAQNIRKIPKQGLTLPGSKGKPDRHFEHHQIHQYVAAKKHSRERFQKNMQNWLHANKSHKHYAAAHDFVKQHYPHLMREHVERNDLLREKYHRIINKSKV
jgi:hypothetical protein